MEPGNRSFFFKMVKNSHKADKVAEFADLEQQFLSISKQWKNTVGASTISIDSVLDDWSEVLHERVAPFVKLYVSMTNFTT